MEGNALHWVEAVASIALRWKQPGMTIRGLFEDARPDLSDRRAFEAFLADRLRHEPALMEAWQVYSWDKRSTPSPYLEGVEVGFYDDGRRDVTTHPDRWSACADFVFREASWVLHRRRAGPP